MSVTMPWPQHHLPQEGPIHWGCKQSQPLGPCPSGQTVGENPSAAGAFRWRLLGVSVPCGQRGAGRRHQAKGKFEVRTEWKKEGATWRLRGPASSQD